MEFNAVLPLLGVRILFVEDDLNLLVLMTDFFEQAGAEVRALAQAIEALEVIEETQFDIIISNIIMPEMDGYTLLRQIQAQEAQLGRRPTPSIALTAAASEVERQRILSAGFQAYQSKPFEPNELISLITSQVKANS